MLQYFIDNYNIDKNTPKEIINEVIYCFMNDINWNERPICPVCGKLVPYIHENSYGYPVFCSSKCMNSDEGKNIVNNKRIETYLELFGVENISQSEEIKQKIKETLSLKYGSPTFNNRQKAKETNLVRYGVDSYARTNDFKQNYKNHLKEYKDKEYKTKKKNHTFNTSKLEIKTFELLKEKYPDVIYQYRDKDRYPFVCDFYIPSLDLFIECNYHWTHGGKPYEGTEEDNKIIDGWKSKNSQYYNNAINCWTIRDVNKRNIAKQNNLNYIEIWNINELNRL